MNLPKLRLKREPLAELTPGDLGSLAGAVATLPSCAPSVRTCTCGATNTCGCGATRTCVCVHTATDCLTPTFAAPPDTGVIVHVGLCG